MEVSRLWSSRKSAHVCDARLQSPPFGMIALAREAGEVILGFYDGRAEVALKADSGR